MRAGPLRLPNPIRAAADGDLLRRFADARDEAAFAELVRRHGPLVLAVCRRVVSDPHLADDAFQAAFVVLARKAGSAGVGARLSTWLYAVAVRVSLRARTMAGRRAKRETLTATVPDRGAAVPPADDTAAVVDEEIAALPQHLRAAVVLCELRGVSRRDAARELGVAEGTLSSRLAAARKWLAERLRARGLAPAAGGLAAAVVPADLAAAAVAASTGKAELSARIFQLVEGGMTMALLTKLKLAAVTVALAVLAAGGFDVGRSGEADAAPVPKDAADPGVIWLSRPAEGELVGYTPDGKVVRTVKFTAGGTYPGTFIGITRDGQHALVAAAKGTPPRNADAGYEELHAGELTVHLWPLFTPDPPTDTGIGCQYWSRYVIGRDGKTLVVEHDRSPRDPKGVPEHPIRYETVAYDLSTLKSTRRPALPERHTLVEELANGDRLLAFGRYGSDKRPLQSFHLLPAGSDRPKPPTGDDETDFCTLSPDGATLLVTRAFASKWSVTDSYHRMYLLDRATGKAEPFAHRPNTRHAHGHWSPDGTRVVYEWLEEGPQLPAQNIGGGLTTTPISRGQVVVADANGNNEKVILELDGCPETDLAKAQAWHDARPKLVGWYPSRRNAPVPKPAAAWKEATPITFADGGRVTSVAYSPSGKTLAVTRGNGKLDFYDPATRKRITTMNVVGEKGAAVAAVTAIAFCPEPHPKTGDVFAVTHKHGVKFGTVSLGIFADDAAKVDGIPPNVVAKDLDPHKVICLGQDRFVAGNGGESVWRVPDGDLRLKSRFGTRGQPNLLAAIPGASGFFLENGHVEREVNDVYMAAEPPASSPQTRLSGHRSRPVAAAVSKDGKRIVTADGGGTLIVWDTKQGLDFKEKSRVQLGNGVAQLAVAPDGKTVAVLRAFVDTTLLGTSGRVLTNLELHVFDVTDPPAKPTPLWTARNVLGDRKADGPFSLAFGPDGRTLLAAFADPYTADKDARSMGVKVWTLGEPDGRKRNAPVPKEKDETMGLTANVAFDKREVMLGEPVFFQFKVSNPNDVAWQFEEGGDYRNRLGRPNSFAVIVTGPDGRAVPQPDSGMDMGGISVMVPLPANGSAAFQPLFLPHWATFDKPGEYTVTVRRKVGLVPAEAEDGFRAKATPATLSASAKITVTATDAKRMGELIETMGKDMLDPKSPDSDKSRKTMLAIRDPRVIPHLLALGKKPHPSYRYAACEALGHFKTDEAFAALKTLYATTGFDLRESATTQELADSSANGVRHAAIGAILECGHPEALAFGWKMALTDGYDGVRLTALLKAYEVKSPEARAVIAALLNDPEERIRNEAKRYTDLLAKEKK